MPSIDMPLEQMRQYKPTLYRQPDFEEFWDQTIRVALAEPVNAELIPYDLPTRGVECFAVRFDGTGGGRLAGWYVRPFGRGKFPGVCFYHGYGGRAWRPVELLPYAAQGICCLSMDCRGQNGQSQDTVVYSEGHHSGWMTQGIRHPRNYYYRYVFADAVRAIELLARRDEVDGQRIAVTGISQGGGMTLAAAALSERPILAMADVPFLCDYRRAIQIATAGPYPEIASFFKTYPDLYEPAMATLSYCDCVNLAPWITCRTIVSNCLWDDVCPPSTVFGAYNQITAEKRMDVYPFHKHEVPYDQAETRLRVFAEVLRP